MDCPQAALPQAVKTVLSPLRGLCDGWAVMEEATGRLRALRGQVRRNVLFPELAKTNQPLLHPQCPQQELRTPHREPSGPSAEPSLQETQPRADGKAQPSLNTHYAINTMPAPAPILPKALQRRKLRPRATNHGVAGWGPEPGSLGEQGLLFSQGPSTDHSLRVQG